MPRIGINPSRGQKTDYRPARVTVAVLTYLPAEAGYYEHRFAVTQLCIESILANTTQPFDLLVFDNGSSPQLVDFLRGLRDEGKIQYLILSSQNVGKLGALQIIFNAAPGEIVAYCDDDVFFLPGWLDEHLKIIDTYPRVGMVTGFYIRSHMRYGVNATLKFATEPEVTAHRGLLNDKKWERHYMESVDRSLEHYAEETQGLADLEITYQGLTTFASSGHHQFAAPRQLMLAALPDWQSGLLMGRMVELENKIDSLGYLRLSTRQPVTLLLGNVISAEMAAEARNYNLDTQAVQIRPPGALERFYLLRPVQWLARKLYKRLFDIVAAGDRERG